jgi:hypothetical protein
MGTTLADLHKIAAHVLGRRRFEVSGHFGLRASPGGLATPAFGPEPEVLRLAGASLVREIGADARSVPLEASTMADLAAFAGTDVAAAFSAGPDTPPAGPVDQPFHVSPSELDGYYDWFELGSRVLDLALCTRNAPGSSSTVQLWPEHFDMATAVELAPGAGVNLGFSPGDSFCRDPYVYVGPWGSERPGPSGYWNAPFGAFVPRAQAPDVAACLEFLRRGLDALVKG